MRLLVLLLAAVLVQRVCIFVGAVKDDLQEVSIDSRVTGVDGVIDDRTTQHETLWSKVQLGLVEQQFGLSSQDFIVPVPNSQDAHKKESGYLNMVTELCFSEWVTFLDGNWLNEFQVQFDVDPGYKAGVIQNLTAMQAFVAFVSIGYAIVAMWLGPMKLTRWQQRSILVTYSTAGIVQVVFLAHAFDFMGIHCAYPLTLALAVLFFVTFNVTNVFLVLESEQPETANPTQVQQIIEVSPTRVVTAQRAPCY